MGSRARIVVYSTHEPVAEVRSAFDAMDRLDRVLTDYNAHSEARRLADLPPGAWHAASPELIDAVVRSRVVWRASGGRFDITVGPLTALWRGADRSPPSEEALGRARDRVGMTLLDVDEDGERIRFARAGMRLDFGGIGKGLACDAALATLRRHGLRAALVELGGDVVVGDPPPGEVGWVLRAAPEAQLVTIANSAIAASGDAYRFTLVEGERLSHVIEPSAGVPAPAGGGATVVACEGWLADALATIAKLDGDTAALATAEAMGAHDVQVIDAYAGR